MYMMDENRVFYQNNEIPFDQLHYDRKLSEGGYGIVYRGRWKYTTVAIKEIKKEIIEQDKLEEFKNECAVMEVIRHPNIVLFLGACTKAPNLCIVLNTAHVGLFGACFMMVRSRCRGNTARSLLLTLPRESIIFTQTSSQFFTVT